MTFVHPFGTLGMIFQILIVVSGLPAQIRILRKTKSAASLSLGYFALCTGSCVCWFVNGAFEVYNPQLFVPQVPAMILGSIIIGQIVYYRYFYHPALSPVPAS